MREFKWNNTRNILPVPFWDHEAQTERQEPVQTVTDKDVIKLNKSYAEREVLEALCRVVSELVDIEEKR